MKPDTYAARRWLSGPLAIEPTALERLLTCNGEDLARMQAAHELVARSAQAQRRQARVSVVPILGFMGYHNWLASMIGTATEGVIASIREATNDPNTDAVVLWVDSPGGEVRGLEELVAEIRRARGVKPVIGVVDAMAGSAAYWAVSQADTLLVTPSGDVGSIGVFVEHVDASAAYEREGLRPSLIGSTSSPYKTEGSDTGPLAEDTRAFLQQKVDAVAHQFIAAVATGRKTSQRAVRETFGGGRMVAATDAVKIGMADKIGTLEDALAFAVTRAKADALVAAEGLATSMAEVAVELSGESIPPDDSEQSSQTINITVAGTADRAFAKALAETILAGSEPESTPEAVDDADYRRTKLAIAKRRQARPDAA